MFAWLFGAAVGPAAVALPVNWAADALATAAQRWFKRLRRTDDLSRLIKAATGTAVYLTDAELDALRRLLEDQQTWILLGQGTVDDLAKRIASCLPPGNGRTAEDSRTAALVIARGLLEFAAADLDPKLFQQVLLTRLQRIVTEQASNLDNALLDLHADLFARFTSLTGQFKQALERLPPGSADRAEVALYLQMLIEWTNTDPWPQDRRFGGPVLTPAAIERPLWVTTISSGDKRVILADALIKQCRRLVILGGPGSGKTWLAKRAARHCAEQALESLAQGGTLDEVELPLYITCSRLFSAVGDIRGAAVSSALDQLGDLGGIRIISALRAFFTERNAPTLLVIDSLDEAHGSDERLRQVDTLPWRIILTSRPSSWDDQLAIKEDSDDRVCELQPLRYPEDVERFIQRWFDADPDRGEDLAAQLARRANLRQASTVPLILAFYCIVGSHHSLPEFRRDLYAKVLSRMLTSRWRGRRNDQLDVDSCLQTLRGWAWSGATTDTISGIGAWTDDISVGPAWLGEAEINAVDHVATPLGPPDVDNRETLRRFVHRSIREYLVADHVARLGVNEATEILLLHIWYDADWEYAAPAALVMHPHRNELLRDLICRAARSDEIPTDLCAIDAGWELREFLAKVAAESCEADWLPELASMIGQARLELAQSGSTDHLGEAATWVTSNRQVREALLDLLARQTHGQVATKLVGGLIKLGPTAENMRRAREALLRLFGRPDRYLGSDRAREWVGRPRADRGGQEPGSPQGA